MPNEPLPQPEYQVPIIRALLELGGRARRADVLVRVEELLAGQLTDAD